MPKCLVASFTFNTLKWLQANFCCCIAKQLKLAHFVCLTAKGLEFAMKVSLPASETDPTKRFFLNFHAFGSVACSLLSNLQVLSEYVCVRVDGVANGRSKIHQSMTTMTKL